MIISKLSSDYQDFKMGIKGPSCMQLKGNEELVIENCRSVISYDMNYILLELMGMYLTIVGENFRITSFSNDGVIISGDIHSLEFELITEKRRN